MKGYRTGDRTRISSSLRIRVDTTSLGTNQKKNWNVTSLKDDQQAKPDAMLGKQIVQEEKEIVTWGEKSKIYPRTKPGGIFKEVQKKTLGLAN